MRRSLAGGALAVATAVLIAACASSSSSTPATSGSGTAQQSAGQSSAPPASTPASGPAASPHAVGLPECPTSSLQLKLGPSDGAAGSVYQTIDFVNSGSTTCTLYGYPGVSLTGGSPPAQIGAAAERDRSKAPALVTLAAGAAASAVVQVVQAGNYPAASCAPAPASALLVYPPGQTASVSLPYAATGCASTSVVILRVSPVAGG